MERTFSIQNKRIWDFVNSFVSFNRYTNSPIARYKDKIFNLPFNMNTFHEMWNDVYTPADACRRLEEQRALSWKRLKAIGISEPRNLEEHVRILVGDDIYETLVKGYTEKQWGRKCDELSVSIIMRLPIRFVYDNNYFNAAYQGFPCGGYNILINGLLDGIETRVNTDYLQNKYELDNLAEKIIYTDSLDECFDYCYGCLQYRSVRFETEKLMIPNYQGNAVVNYTDKSVPYTRVIEYKHFEQFGDEIYKTPHTVVSREFSFEYMPGKEPFYPIKDVANNSLYAKYRKHAESLPNFEFGGRLADYAYYDMDKVIENVFSAFHY